MNLDRSRLAFPDLCALVEELVREEVSRQLAALAKHWITAEEASRRTGLSVRAVRNRAHAGQFESKKVGRRLLVRL